MLETFRNFGVKKIDGSDGVDEKRREIYVDMTFELIVVSMRQPLFCHATTGWHLQSFRAEKYAVLQAAVIGRSQFSS